MKVRMYWYEEEPVPKCIGIKDEILKKLRDFVEGKTDYVELYADSYTYIRLEVEA